MSEETFTRWVDPTIEEKDKEIERLKEENEQLMSARYSLDRVELEQRINKAIEYINSILKTEFCDIEYEDGKELLEILKGVDKE